MVYGMLPKEKGNDIDLLAFTRQIVQTFLAKYTEIRLDKKELQSCKKRVPIDVCLDGLNHYLIKKRNTDMVRKLS